MIRKLHTFNIVTFKVDGGAMFGVVPKTIWTRFVGADENNLIPLALRSLVVETEDRKVLIDNGIGNKQDKRFMNQLHLHNGDGLEGGLSKGGYTTDDITDVILTHLHFDHCGGSIYKNANGELLPVFRNATYHISQRQWENALNPNIREADAYLPENILPIQASGQLHLVERETMLCEEIELRMVHGHTPGQIIPIIHLSGKKLIFGADLFPTHGHIPIKYNMAYDLDVTQTMEEKQSFLDEFCRPENAILFEHDVRFECGQALKTEKGYRFLGGMTLAEWINAQ